MYMKSQKVELCLSVCELWCPSTVHQTGGDSCFAVCIVKSYIIICESNVFCEIKGSQGLMIFSFVAFYVHL